MDGLAFMQWTIMPAEIMARVWKNYAFKKQFCKNPVHVLEQYDIEIDDDVSFCIVENTPDTTYLVLPYRSHATYKWGRKKVISTLKEETGEDNSLDYWLPVPIMAEAYLNPDFKRKLLLDASAALNEMGYDVGNHKYVVLENTHNLFHLSIPLPKWDPSELSVDELESLVIDDFTEDPLMLH